MHERVVPWSLAERVAKATGNDVDHTRIAVDAALSRPRDRLNLLRRYGIGFDVAQVTAIDNHMRYNRKHLAQQIILRAIEHAYPADGDGPSSTETATIHVEPPMRRYAFRLDEKRSATCMICAAMVRNEHMDHHAIWHDTCTPRVNNEPIVPPRLNVNVRTTDLFVYVSNGRAYRKAP